MKYLKLFLPLLQYTVVSIALYFAVDFFIFGDPFAAMMRMSAYHDKYPLQFISVTCLTFFLTQLLLSRWLLHIKYHFLRYLFFYLFWICIASILGGLLWSYYDMEAGWYPQGDKLKEKLLEDMLAGLNLGPVIIVFSIPYNVLVFAGSFLILKYNHVLVKRKVIEPGKTLEQFQKCNP